MASTAEKIRPGPAREDPDGPVQDLAPVELPQEGSQAAEPAGQQSGPRADPHVPVAMAGEEIMEAIRIARQERGAQRELTVAALNLRIRALGESADREAAADFLLKLLDSRFWTGLEEAEDGWTVRATVVAVVINLGYPYALQVAPEDLQHLREVQARPAIRRPHRARWAKWVRRASLLVLGVGTASALLQDLPTSLPAIVIGMFAWVGAWIQVGSPRWWGRPLGFSVMAFPWTAILFFSRLGRLDDDLHVFGACTAAAAVSLLVSGVVEDLRHPPVTGGTSP